MKITAKYFKLPACLRAFLRGKAGHIRKRACLPGKFAISAIALIFTIAGNSYAAITNGSNTDIVLGQSGFTNAYPNVVSSGTFNGPCAVGNYSNDPLFVVDRENSRVLFWRSPLTDPLENGQPADGVIGQADFTAGKANRGGAAGANTLNRPCGVAYNSGENTVWIADCGNNRLLRFSNPPNFGASADMVLGQAGYTSVTANRGGAVAANALSNPTDVARDYLSGDIWVADPGNHRIVKYACIYSAGCTFADNASLVVGQDNLNSDYYPSQVSSKTVTYFSNDTELGITVDNGGNLWVADTNANRVLKFTTPVANGSSATIVLGQADFNASSSNRGGAVAANTLFKPSQVSVSVDQSVVWVADTYNFRVLKFTTPMVNGAAASLVLGQQDFASALSGVANMMPVGVFLPRYGTDLWVADGGNNRLLKFSNPAVNGVSPDRVVGKANLTMSGPNYVEGRGLYSPYGMVVDSKRNRVFVSDTSNHRVLWWNNLTSYVNGKAADGVLGQANLYSRQVNRGLTAPQADTLAIPGGLALDTDGNIWVADSWNNRVLRYNGASLVSGVAAEFVLGQADFVSKDANRGGGAAQNTLNYPRGVGIDSNGNIWVGDSINNRVLKFSGSGLANGANAALVLGQADFTSVSSNQGVAAGQATLSWPSAIRCQNNDVWVIDGGNHRVLKYVAPAVNGANAGLVLGQTTFSGTSIGCQPNKFLSVANGVNIDSDAMGNLWVPDQGGSRVLRFEPPFNNGMNASVVLGQADFTTCSENRGGSAGVNTLKNPHSVAVDPKLNVYVGDTDNNRVMIFNSGLAATELSPTFTARANTSITTSWTAVPGANYVAVLSSDSGYSSIVSSVTQSENTKALSGLASGTTYYFQVKLSTETDIAFALNRISTTTTIPSDLVVQNLAVSPSSGVPGVGITVTFRVYNQGAGAANASTTRIRYSEDSSLTTSDTLLSEFPTASIAADSYIDVSKALNIPSSGVTAGSRYIGATLDVFSAAGQSDESNDQALTGFTVLIPPTVTSITPNSGINNTDIAITDLAGTRFAAGVIVKLTKAGQADINATSISIVSASQIICTLPLSGAATGLWNVVITNTDAQSGTLGNGFTVTLDITPPEGVPSTPSAGVAYTSSTAITFDWNQGTSADPESGIAGYYFQAGNNPAVNDTSVFDGYAGDVSSKTFTGVNEGAYYARVRAKNPYNLYGGYTPWSAAVIVDTTPPPAPSVVSLTHPESTVTYIAPLITFNLSVVDASGISGYYRVIDQSSTTVPTGGSGVYFAGASTEAAASAGEWFAHFTGVDGAGNIGGDAGHYRFNIGSTINPSQDAVFQAADGTKVVISSGTLTAAASISISAPASVPAEARDPNIKDTGIYREISLSDPALVLQNGVTVLIPYNSTQISPAAEDSLKLSHYNGVSTRWEVLYNSVVDKINNTVSALVTHFSPFKIIAYTPQTEEITGAGNYPNPFAAGRGGQTKIHYSLKANSAVEIRIYDLLGKLVWHKSFQSGVAGGIIGVNDIPWDGKNDGGNYVGAGGYICLIKAGGETRKVKIAVK